MLLDKQKSHGGGRLSIPAIIGDKTMETLLIAVIIIGAIGAYAVWREQLTPKKWLVQIDAARERGDYDLAIKITHEALRTFAALRKFGYWREMLKLQATLYRNNGQEAEANSCCLMLCQTANEPFTMTRRQWNNTLCTHEEIPMRETCDRCGCDEVMKIENGAWWCANQHCRDRVAKNPR